MAQFIVRDIPDDVAEKVEALAGAAGTSREAWLRDLIVAATRQPIVHQRYALKAWAENGGYAQIRRTEDAIGGGSTNLNEQQMQTYKKAKDFVQRNEPGDREAAIALLKTYFEDVFETLM